MLSVPPRLLVFDLDGTLIDSRADLANSVNAMLVHFRKEPLSEETISGYIGEGAEALVRRSLAHAHSNLDESIFHEGAFVEEALYWFLAYYRDHKVDKTYVYPGVLESLQSIRLTHPSLPMAVLTNKPVGPSRAICAHFGLDNIFFQNYGGDSFCSKKPDPEGFYTLMREASALVGLEIRPSEAVMVGDSFVDVETAKNAGAGSVGCLFGLSPETVRRAKPDVLVSSAWEWRQALGL